MRRAWAILAARLWRAELGVTGAALRVALIPAEACFAMIVALRSQAYARGLLRTTRVAVPVISVGNLTVGGEGKTPFTAFLVDALRRRGARPAVVHGGYAADEPQLHRVWHPDVAVYVARDRVAAAGRAAEDGAQVVLLDDAFQHRRLARDLDIVLVGAERWRDRPRLLPAGPWREPPRALRRADLIIITRKTATRAEAETVLTRVERVAPGVPTVMAMLAPAGWRVGPDPAGPPEGPAFGVVAIAMPELFAGSARAAGAAVDQVLAFPDHHAFSPDDVEAILREARGRPIVTTEKDAVKLAPFVRTTPVWVLKQEVRIERGGSLLDRALDTITP